MTKLTKTLSLIVLSLACTGLTHAWTIDKFASDILIKSDGSIEVTEKISANFSDNRQKHGIIRNIPFIYKDKDNKDFRTSIEIISVKNKNGRPHNYKISTLGAEKLIKIGDANKYVNAEEFYEISYSLKGVINPFASHDELFWNVTGNRWNAPIIKATAVVRFEKENTSLKTKCFTGRHGSKEQNCKILENTSVFSTTQKLNTGDGLTIVVGFDKNLVPISAKEYISPQSSSNSIDSNKGYNLPSFFALYPFLLLIYPIKKLFDRKKELQSDNPVIPKYLPPKGLTASECGVLFDNAFDSRDLSAGIITLCLKKSISIEEIEKKGFLGKSKDYKFHLLSIPTNLTPLENEIVDTLFDTQSTSPNKSVTLSNIGYNLGDSFHTFSTKAEDQLKEKELFYEKSQCPSLVKLTPLFAFISSFLGIYLTVSIDTIFASSFLWNIVVMFASVFLIIKFPSKKTRAGAEFKHEAECYKEFIKTAEKEQINWEERQKIFETHLPFAIALGLTKHWSKIFAGAIQIPTWYKSTRHDHDFTFTEDIESFSNSFTSEASPQQTSSSSGDSGFSDDGGSGGGYGGGGGSDW